MGAEQKGPGQSPVTLLLGHCVFALVLIVVRFEAEITFFDDLRARHGFKRERQLAFVAGENILPRVLGHSLKLDALVPISKRDRPLIYPIPVRFPLGRGEGDESRSGSPRSGYVGESR